MIERNRHLSRTLIALLGAGFSFACVNWSLADATQTCLGTFCVEADRTSEKDLVARYGPGWVESTKFPSHCYALPDQRLEVQFSVYHGDPHDVLSVFASNARICRDVEGPLVPLPRLATSEGLAIGDSRARVLELYGPPTKEIARSQGHEILDPFGRKPLASDIGDTILRYRPAFPRQTPILEVYLKEGIVSSLFLSSYP